MSPFTSGIWAFLQAGMGLKGVPQSCSSCDQVQLHVPWGPGFHRGSTDEKGGKHWGPICLPLSSIIKVMPSAKERWSFMSKCFFSEPLWRWLKHFLKRWRQRSSQSPQTQFHWKQSPICLVMDCLPVPTNGTSWLISLGCSPQRNTTQTHTISCDFCWNVSILILGLHLVRNSPLVRHNKHLFFPGKTSFWFCPWTAPKENTVLTNMTSSMFSYTSLSFHSSKHLLK